MSRHRELASIRPQGTVAVTDDPTTWPSSYEPGSPSWQAAVVNSALTPDVVIGPEWSPAVTMTGWMATRRESVEETTGEVSHYPWLVFQCADGSIVGTSSPIVAQQLARLLAVYPPEQWARGVSVQFRRRTSRSGDKSYHEMRVSI